MPDRTALSINNVAVLVVPERIEALVPTAPHGNR